jgi:hypothetical protein
MTDFEYPKPVSRLLTMGDCRGMRQWPDYLALGIGPEHVPDLVRMIQDEELTQADSQSLEVWAPVHAWRTLGAGSRLAHPGPTARRDGDRAADGSLGADRRRL